MTTRDEAMAALAAVTDPVFQRPLVALGLLDSVDVEGTTATMRVFLSAPGEAVRQATLTAVRQALTPLGITDANITFELRVPTRETSAEDPLPEVKNVVL